MPRQRPSQRSDRRTSTVVVRASVEADGRFVARITIISDWTRHPTPHAVSNPEDLVTAVRTWLAEIGSEEPDLAP
jgi:hypothetical protein